MRLYHPAVPDFVFNVNCAQRILECIYKLWKRGVIDTLVVELWDIHFSYSIIWTIEVDFDDFFHETPQYTQIICQFTKW